MTRRTQSERSATTREALVEAAIDSLVEHGWAATTTVEVCRRTGLTRGALVHHFDGLPALLAAALDSLYDEMAARPTRPVTSLRDVVEETWARLSAPRFKAVLEAWMAMANDPSLAASIGPVVARFAKLVSAAELPTGSVLAEPGTQARYLTIREALLGLAVGRALSGGVALGHEAQVLRTLRADADRADADRADAGDRP